MSCQHFNKGIQHKGMTNASSRYGCPDCDLWTKWYQPIDISMVKGYYDYLIMCNERELDMRMEWENLVNTPVEEQ